MTPRRLISVTLALAAAGALWVGTASRSAAQFSGRGADDVVRVDLLEGWRMEDGRHMAALRIRLAPGWKTYWRAPGDGGIPTRIALASAAGTENVRVHWPTPEVFFTYGLRSIGYRGDVILPLEMDLAAPGPLAVTGAVELGVCQDVCMPVTVEVGALLPAAGEGRDRDPRILAALADRPQTAAEAGTGPATCRVTPIDDGVRVDAEMRLPPLGDDETVVMELPEPGVWISEPESVRSGVTLTATADVVPAEAIPFDMDRSTLRITVLGSRAAIEFLGCRG